LRDELLRQAARNNEQIKVVLTRDTDINLPGIERARKAFEHKAKLFLCFHFNGDQNASIRGSETFYRAPENGNLNLDDDIAFARQVHEAMISAMLEIDANAKDRRVKPDTQTNPGALGVLNDRHLGNDRVERMCRAAYIEAEFITNPTADRLLISGVDAIANRTKIMAAVAKACRTHMRGMPP
jgi:N-acetylmuramoyl-L-alanine amidase